ncbi:HMP-PP phosphatase [Shimwellia blattae]|uniref:HMP-PP phosphatase n=1 Tax=Shimwellia blattae (strain ATCC 29907 / DSM 4481 / JCM 1650 / NBRC 105725 / CDC 9005-74) TaxID=630626 RepID=I2BBP2_SHIBC|nr:HMP-PP phosphatase [Shimwellia blattae]AFJ47946.1 thiamin pyrimidine pyrophosphate hydrolase [Shimwellia blattae DSM 4481 = NBRC 105725]GAB82784.1 HMP-PP phosphatase [Shimwellia blattae DSM 4481 = NBRC 105725]VDY65446.1 HMP-PP phosphatase [Shimwellia blattae]VEC24621.1 HMP-PP phosphatase [Shimwellia blattae]
MTQLVAFDMDGTLLMPDHRPGDETLRTLGRLRERGITLTFATGRHILEMQPLLRRFGLSGWLITGNGTRIHSASGEPLFRCDLAPEVAESVLHSHWDTRASMHVFNDSGWLTDKPLPELLKAHGYSGFQYQLADLRRLSAHEVTKICFCGDHEDLCQLRIALQEQLGDSAAVCFSAVDCLEVLPHNCNKGTALRALSERLAIPLRECMAFGDAMNDQEMLSCVGRGVIMGNAMPQLIQSLPQLPVIGHCAGQAIAHYLTHWLDTPHLSYSPE